MKKILLLCFCFFAWSTKAQDSTSKMQWFADAKLGVFLHWGIYAANGIDESWSFFNNYISHADYLKQLQQFTAKKYKPNHWANLIEKAGAKYAVITTKHHDGIALWDTKQPKSTSIPQHAKAQKDVLTPFVKAVRRKNIKLGLYYSLPDWSYPDYDVFTSSIKRYNAIKDTARFGRFVHYYQAQLKELLHQYHPDLLWFDGDWEHTATEWKAKETRKMLLAHNPNMIINARLKNHGDYATPEQGIPIYKPASSYWELCYTMNKSWGYQPFDKKYKSANMLINTLVDCMTKGGNLLLDIAPKADGTLPKEQVVLLKKLGRWTHKHREAIYETIAGIEQKEYFIGKTTFSKDRKTLFLYINYKPSAPILIHHLKNSPIKASVVGYPKHLLSIEKKAYTHAITIPTQLQDDDVTVLRLDFDAPVSFENPVSEKKLENWASANIQPNIAIQQLLNMLFYGKTVELPANFSINNSKLAGEYAPALQRWMQKHAEILSQKLTALPINYFAGKAFLSQNKRTIYLLLEGKPTGELVLKGVKNNVLRVRIVGEGTMLTHTIHDKVFWNDVPGIITIDVPKERTDQYATVVAILLDAPLALFKGEIKSIETNY